MARLRRALAALAAPAVLAAQLLPAAPARAGASGVIAAAEYAEPTTRYDHGILGDAVEWGALVLTLEPCPGCEGGAQRRRITLRLPETRVFEDIAPRLVTLPGSAGPAVMVVETDLRRGARLALYGDGGLIASTPFIGRPHRWLAPLGAADLDGDGNLEIAYVDRPHLAKTIRIWRFRQDGGLAPVADLPGFTNHRIGWNFIPGGIRDCGGGPEMIVADADWQGVHAVSFRHGRFRSRRLGPYEGPPSLDHAMACRR